MARILAFPVAVREAPNPDTETERDCMLRNCRQARASLLQAAERMCEIADATGIARPAELMNEAAYLAKELMSFDPIQGGAALKAQQFRERLLRLHELSCAWRDRTRQIGVHA